MTGKKRKNSKSYWVEDTPEKLDYINETLYEENMNLNKELTKYKRAFEILKEKLDLTARECCDKYKKAFKKDYEIVAYSYHTFITKEQYELLEELMKDEEIR